VITQQGQVFKLKTRGADGTPLWAYRYRLYGRGSARPQVGGFATQGEALQALQVALERLHRRNGRVAQITLAELVEEYLAQHEAAPRTIAKLRWLLAKATGAFGDRCVVELQSEEIGAWRATLPEGHRCEATHALRQVLNRAVAWKIIDSNPAKVGVDNPRRQHPEKRPFESWTDIEGLAEELGPVYGPMMVFAAATGLRPGEWIALELRDLDREARVVYVRRAFAHGRLTRTKTRRSTRAVPLQAIALEALDRLPARADTPLLFPAPRGGYLDLHNFRRRVWKPAQRAAGIVPMRRPYDLRHTFATFALRAGISTFDLSRFMGASLAMIDRHYGHLARDGREHAAALLDSLAAADAAPPRGRSVDVAADTASRLAKRNLTPGAGHATARWTFGGRCDVRPSPKWPTELAHLQALLRSPLADSNRRPPLYEEGPCVN
jgi:integrase